MTLTETATRAVTSMKGRVTPGLLMSALPPGPNQRHLACNLLFQLEKKGIIERVGRGVYEVKNPGQIDMGAYTMVFGLEIEAEYNARQVGSITRGGYHEHDSAVKFGEYFFTESDGSLCTRTFNGGQTAEFISFPLPFNEVMPALENFKAQFDRRSGKETPLSDVLSFNQTTGAHIHVSIIKNSSKTSTKNIRGKLCQYNGTFLNHELYKEEIPFFKNIAKKIKKRVKTEMPSFYPSYLKNYYRSYAKRMPNSAAGGRYYEFNNNTAYGTVEWRSSHLRGITTWDDFFTYYRIVTETFQQCFLEELTRTHVWEQSQDLIVQARAATQPREIVTCITTNYRGEQHVQY